MNYTSYLGANTVKKTFKFAFIINYKSIKIIIKNISITHRKVF